MVLITNYQVLSAVLTSSAMKGASFRRGIRGDRSLTDSENVFHVRVVNSPVNVPPPGFHDFLPIARCSSRVFLTVDPDFPDGPGFGRVFSGVVRIMDANEKKFDRPASVFKPHRFTLQVIFVLVFPTPFYLVEGE